jgi:hypothetical protein
VGNDSWEELNYEPVSAGGGRGDNFGWDCREGAHDYTGPEAPGDGSPSPLCPSRVGTFTEPVFEYQHGEPESDGRGPCSIIGGYVVRDLGLGDLYGRYLYMDLCVGEVRSLNLGLPKASDDRSEGVSVEPSPARATSFGEDADGRIYVASLNGPVYRLTGGAPPSNDFSFGKVKKNKKKGTAKLTLKVPGPGELELAKTKKVRGDDDSADEAGKEKLSIKPKGKAKKRLNNKGKAKVKASVTYTPSPTGGSPNTEDKKIKLVKR